MTTNKNAKKVLVHVYIDAGLKCSEACSYQKCDNMNAAADTETEQSDGALLDDLDDDGDFLFDL